MLKNSYNSLNIKIVFLFITLGIFLLTILFLLIVPKMQKEQKDYTTKQIENMIHLTTQQLKLATKAIEEQGKTRRDYVKSIIESKVETIHHKLETIPKADKKNYINTIAKELSCKVYLLDENKNIFFQSSNKPLDIKNIQIDQWSSTKDERDTVCPIAKSTKQIIYTKPSHNKKELLVLDFNPRILDNNNPMKFEYKLKKDIQNSFFLMEELHKGKIYLMWLDEKKVKNSNKPLYEKNDDRYYNNKYCVSKISNLRFPRTGLLSGREILEAIDKQPIKHLIDLDNKRGEFTHPALTWVRSVNGDDDRKLLFITTVLEEDFHSNIDSSFWKILPASLFALLSAIFVSFFIFRRLFKTINILVNTAKSVNEGDINIRSNIKGNDEIGLLGKTFDNMLDSIQKNITQLDRKVEQRTQELQSSLNEKETLLKEIHHRVKNNLAMTIELIKIQKLKLKDDTTKEALSDIQERVFTMELLHKKLYESKDLSSINIKKYVNELANDLHKTYNNTKDIKIDIDIVDTYMDIDYALPCGLIINECLTNSFKHAFKDDFAKVSISLKNIDNKFILKISDNGIGIPDNIDIYKSKTLGLKLVTTIVKNQLFGKLQYLNKNGSTFIIEFFTTKE